VADENNKSDYNKPFMDLSKYLPEPYQSDTNVSLFNNLFNRFLAKQEIDKISGYIGTGNKSAIASRQIEEVNIHRQAYQLQPILHNKIGSIEHMASWKDIQNELERLEIDVEDFISWGATEKFNWAPPIDINKLINYRDYYWVDSERKSPQYITIRNKCSNATSRVTFWNGVITQYGSSFPIEGILAADIVSSLPTYTITSIDVGLGLVVVTGDATDYILTTNFLNITGTVSNDGAYQVTTIPTYDGTTNLTKIAVDGLIANENVGTVTLRRFDKIILGANEIIPIGDYTKLFEEGFIFFLRGISNTELNNTYVEVVSSVADIANNTTIVTINSLVTDNTFLGGDASLEEQLSVYVAEQNCQCSILGGWDDGTLWDDNPSSPLWGDVENILEQQIPDGISDHQNFLDRISNLVPPSTAGTQGEVWYDTLGNRLYQYDTTIGWSIIWNNFNLILDATTGFALWDQTPSCDTRPRIEATEQWIRANKWLHKSDITNFATVKRALQPIIEYDWDLELNEWTYVDYRWAYRKEIDATFKETENTPALIELESITWWELEDEFDANNNTIILDDRYGDLTDWFEPEKRIHISKDTDIVVYEVDYAEYKTSASNYPYRTHVTLKTKPVTSTGDLVNQIPNTYEIYPIETTFGDSWYEYGTHWLFLGAKDALPVPHQVDNSYIPIIEGTIPIEFMVGSPAEKVYEYRLSLYSQTYSITPQSGSPLPVGYGSFVFSDDLGTGSPTTSITTRSLRRKALYGFDDIRVYISDAAGEEYTRQFGNYDEIGEAVLDVVGIDYSTNEFLVGGDWTSYFTAGDTIRLHGNTAVGTLDFTVSSTAPTHPTRIRVNPISSPDTFSDVAVDGELSNVTNPLQGDEFTNTKNVTVYVMGIEFFDLIPAGLNVTVEVGPAAMNELQNNFSKVRMEPDDELYLINGNTTVSQIQYRRVEQVKTKINQYPLFDIFTVNGDPAYKANPIFGYRTSSEYDVNLNTGLRIVFDPVDVIYEFDQFLLTEDNGELLAYRDYANKQEDYWYNPETNTLNFWHGTKWGNKTEMSNQYRKAVISNIEPSIREREIDGVYWYNTTLNKLFKRFIDPNTFIGTWNEITPIDDFVTDINLQTIWKIGLNNELYIPNKVDWERRSSEVYEDEKSTYIIARVIELRTTDPTLSESQATTTATQEWLDDQSNNLSPSGVWTGDWEIPDPLYFNHLHENRKYLDTRELLTHFNTIIEDQPRIPGFIGAKDAMFNLLPINEINYGYGGTIKEFNDGFDTFLSSVFVNNVTPRSLIEFAHDQYEGLLNSLSEIYRKNAIAFLTNIETDNILNLSDYVATNVINIHELNDQAEFIYGDSTTLTDVVGSDDIGVRNWIATLPYVNLVNRYVPDRIIDDNLSVNEVVHHDGHRKEYTLTTATKDIISQLIIKSPDSRSSSSDIGRTSSNLPPNNIGEFDANFDTTLSREGVYWYHMAASSTNVLYRYVVAESGIIIPSPAYPDGTLWMDLTPGTETLRIKDTDFLGNITWDIVDGVTIGDGRLHNGTDPSDLTTATISAWQKIDLDKLLADTVFELENRLYDNVPSFPNLAYDFTQMEENNPTKYLTYLEQAFLDYVSQAEISNPYSNSEYSSTDAFTWNYSRSVLGGGISILEADGLTNAFVVSGDRVGFFDPCTASGTGSPAFASCNSQVDFYVKDSGNNDGSWSTLISTPTKPATYYDTINDVTYVFVEGDVLDALQGTIYAGILPSPILSSEPNNLNDGSESGGYWKDLYTKIYGTPYPHAEPWILQGYSDKPDWWDAEYYNDDINQWGIRTWKYKHGFEIIALDNNNIGSGSPSTYGIFAIKGDYHANFVSNATFNIDSATGSPSHTGQYTVGAHDIITAVSVGIAGTASIIIDDFPPDPAAGIYFPGMVFSIAEPIGFSSTNEIIKTYTIKNVNHVLNAFTITVEEEIVTGDITTGVSFINGTLYNPTTNLTEIKIVGLVANDIPSGRIEQAYGMWENIRIGKIPQGRAYPNGVVGITGIPATDSASPYFLSVPELPTFNYFSVNISNLAVSADGGTTTYEPDSVFPPYWDFVGAFTAVPLFLDRIIRSIYFDYSTEVIAPNSSYAFGDSGNVEWNWRVSSQFLYDQLTVAYRIDPVRYVSSTFGFNFTKVGGLQVDRDAKNTPSHNRITFHGEIVNNTQFKSNGLNQWYVNYNRYTGYDANFSDFRELWTGWKAPLTYQFASFVDTPSLNIAHRYVNITNFDYNITSKRAPGVDDFWLDALKIGITNIPYNIARYDNQLDWRFELKTNLPISRTIKYYDVHNYQFYTNPTTNVCTMYTWEISDLDTFNKTFTVEGDQTYVFSAGRQFVVANSTGNNGDYVVVLSTYDSITKNTTIFVNAALLSNIKDGTITADYRSLPWSTGDGVYLSTAEVLPIPLEGDTVNGLTKYFIIRLSNNTFALSETLEDANTNLAIDITSTGNKDHFIGEILNTFLVNAGERTTNNWRFYSIDKSHVLQAITPRAVQGMQTLINVIHGYDAYIEDSGWKINEDSSLQDPDSGRLVNWQIEIERFITYAYSQRVVREQVNDRYPVTVDAATNIWTFVSDNKTFITGEPVTIISSNSIYPTPLSRGIRYYLIRDDMYTFRLAASKQDAKDGIVIDITSITSVGSLSVSSPTEYGAIIKDFEINPFRNAAWFNPSRGIVSNIITGPSEDIRTSQLIFDQDGNRINIDQLRVFRQDTQTKVSVIDAINATPTIPLISPEYTLTHLGGLHLFVDAYEHAMILSNYTSDGNLLYDPFIGLNVTKYEMLFNRQPEFTQRPNVGGYYLETFFNQGANIKENIEAGVENLRNAYDTHNTLESNLMTQYSRKTLGYDGPVEYLSNLNLSQKSQFLFWRGQIQSKGSINAVNAFINSRRFIDAKIDDFWAIKLGSFGSIAEKEFPEMYVTTVDARSNELRLEFISNEDDDSIVEDTFTPIKMANTDRWYNQPDQSRVLRNNGKILYFALKVKNKMVASISGSPMLNYIRHDLDADAIELTQYVSATQTTETLKEGIHYRIINNNIIEMLFSGSPTMSLTDDVTIWGMVFNNDAQDPARIIDRKSATHISPIQYWDPARGIHYSNAIHNVDLQNDNDPALYGNTSKTITNTIIWKESFVGTTWLNTKNQDYLPYYSKEVFTDTTERFRNWGQLTDWADIEIFEWVESDVPPSEWDALAAKEEGDKTIVEHLRKAGIARKVLLEKDGVDWIQSVNKFEELYAATDGIDNLDGTFTFDVPVSQFVQSASPLQYLVNVYVNGSLLVENMPLTSPIGSPLTSSTIVAANVADIVRFVQLVPKSQTGIDLLLAGSPETHRQEYEYTQVPYYDKLGNITYKYYFWVGNKGTKPSGKNRTMSILETQHQLVSIPTAHMFFQEVKPAATIPTDNINVLRTEFFAHSGSPDAFALTLLISPDFENDIIVEVNGVNIPSTEYDVYNTGSPLQTFVRLHEPPFTSEVGSPSSFVATGSPLNDITITYTGIDNKGVDVPTRFTQTVIRGLQGIVNADNRYTVRFSRNFTLRDTLDVENENVSNLGLKNLHEEWKIFRQEQQFNIDRWQWDKITESIVGYKLTDPSVRVPSYERELYDEKYDTDTQYGLDIGQSFVNGNLALNTIVSYLVDPNIDFTPIDIDIFFENNNFNTTDNIIKAMDEIYNTFTFTNVNRMYFSVLKDAFTTKSKYVEIFKTSMISLHGIRPFQTSGIFDD